ncbi:MAG: hypothetical protein ACR2PK_11965 [Acidimicrobiales bacterium]
MAIHKLTSTNAFVAFDLEGVPASGLVRCAPKILQGGAKDLARSQTYTFATAEMKKGGASAGINAQPDERDTAITAFVEELTPMSSEGALSLDAGKGVTADLIQPLRDADDRSSLGLSEVDGETLASHLAGLGPVIAAGEVVGGLDGRRVAIEGFGASGPLLAATAARRGARVVSISTTKGNVSSADGFGDDELREMWGQNAEAMVGDDADPAWKVFGAEVDVLFAGSKAGAINHDTADRLACNVVVPHSPLPYTARALAVMQRGNITAVPDFIPLAAPAFAWWPEPNATADDAIATATAAVESAIAETRSHEDGFFLGACYRAETFLGSWLDELPFGRPLAS